MDKKRFSLARVFRLYRIYSGTFRVRIKDFLKSFLPTIPKIDEKGLFGLIAYWNRWGVIGLTPIELLTLNRLLRSEVDWLLESFLRETPQGFSYRHIKRVVAASRDDDYRGGSNLRWILQLDDGRFVSLYGWYDRTGLEPRTMLETWFTTTVEGFPNDEIEPWLLPGDRVSHTVSKDIHQDLINQIQTGRRSWEGFRNYEARSFMQGQLL
jgi:hypothetical protein